MEYRWAKEAYFKVAFHASKFLTSPLFGLLLGHKSEANSQQVLIVDSIPLFHTSPVASSLEIALLEIDEYATKHQLSIIGVYTASSMTTKFGPDSAVSPVVAKTASKIKSFFADAFVLVVSDQITQSKNTEPAGKLYISSGENWTTVQRQVFEEPNSVPSLLAVGFEAQIYRQLVDFDEYLDDATKDWTNAALFSKKKDD